MKAGDFCSNWTGNSQVPPIGLDAWANVLHTEGLHIHKQLRILAASLTLGLFSESGCTQRSPTMSILSISSASTLDQQHQFPDKQHPQKRKIWLYWLRRSKFDQRNQKKEKASSRMGDQNQEPIDAQNPWKLQKAWIEEYSSFAFFNKLCLNFASLKRLCTFSPSHQGDRIRTYGPLYPKQMRWPDCATPRLTPSAYRSTRSMNTRTELAHPFFWHRDART